MKLEPNQINEVKAQISEFVGDYAEKAFDHEKFFAYFFAMYNESSSIEDFEKNCIKELPDFFGDNTENFVYEVLRIIPSGEDNPKLEAQPSKVSTNRNRGQGSNSDIDNFSDDIDDGFSNDDEDVDWRRRHKDDQSSDNLPTDNPNLSKNASDVKKDRSSQRPSGNPPSINPNNPQNQIRKNPPPAIQPINKMPPHQYGNWPPTVSYPTGPYPMYPMPYMPPSYPPMFPPNMIPPHKPPEDKEYDPLKGKGQNPGFRQQNNDNQTGKKRKNSRADEENKTSKVVVTDDNSNKQPQKIIIDNSEAAKSKTIVYVKNIPDYYNNVDALNKQFKRFGPIVNIKVDLKAKMSTIEFVRPKQAKSALSNKPLFGNKDILLTDDPNMTLEDEANEQKKDQKLLDKLKFLIEIKKFIPEAHKNIIMDFINSIKQAQKTKEIGDNLTKFLEEPIFDLSIDHSQIIEDVPANYLEQKAQLTSKLESYGKLENFKLNPKTKIAEFKFFSLDHAKKANEELSPAMKIKYANEKIWDMVAKVKDFEEKFCSKKNGSS